MLKEFQLPAIISNSTYTSSVCSHLFECLMMPRITFNPRRSIWKGFTFNCLFIRKYQKSFWSNFTICETKKIALISHLNVLMDHESEFFFIDIDHSYLMKVIFTVSALVGTHLSWLEKSLPSGLVHINFHRKVQNSLQSLIECSSQNYVSWCLDSISFFLNSSSSSFIVNPRKNLWLKT